MHSSGKLCSRREWVSGQEGTLYTGGVKEATASFSLEQFLGLRFSLPLFLASRHPRLSIRPKRLQPVQTKMSAVDVRDYKKV